VDEETIDSFDYVRANIMVMDLEKVPFVAHRVLGECLYDFHCQSKHSEEEFKKIPVQKNTTVENGKGK
jgi:hypothetical protein